MNKLGSNRGKGNRGIGESAMQQAMSGKVNMAVERDEGCRTWIQEQEEEVGKNRHSLSNIIDHVEFSGAAERSLCDYDENESSEILLFLENWWIL